MRFFFLFFLLFFSTSSFADISDIKILGNKRISDKSILDLIDRKTKNVDSFFINDLTKKIYSTEFFSDVTIDYKNNILNIKVSENPVVNFFYLDGVKDAEKEDLYKILYLKENSIFSTNRLNQDLTKVIEFYKKDGYFKASIKPEVIKIEGNQVNVIFNINKGDKVYVKNVYFIGDKYFSSSQLISQINTTEYKWWNFFSSPYFNEDILENDKKMLRDYYQSKGFYDVQIESSYAALENNNINITFSVNSGKIFNFGKVDFQFDNFAIDKDLNEVKNITNKLLINKIYSSTSIKNLNEKIVNYLESKNYSNLNVNIIEKKDISMNNIDVAVTINKSPVKYINRINVTGNDITKEKTIRDQMSISEGDYLNNFRIKRSIDQIKSKGYIKDVTYNIKDTNRNDYKDIDFAVKEQPSGSIGAGIGYGTQGPLITLDFKEKNLLGNGTNVGVNATLGTQKVMGSINVESPNFNDSGRIAGNTVYIENDKWKSIGGLDDKKLGDTVYTVYEVYEKFYLSPSITAQVEQLNTSSASTSYLQSQNGTYNAITPGYRLTFDNRDSKFSPTSGYSLFLSQSFDVPGISDRPGIVTTVGGTVYHELINKDFIGSVKFKVADASSLSSSPVKMSERLYLSANELRGFSNRRTGPYEDGIFVGGNYLANLNFETSFPNPIPENWRALSFLFYDIGETWGTDFNDTNLQQNQKLRMSAGIGLNFTTPLGPIGLTYGIPISKGPYDSTRPFFFTIGGVF